VGTNPVGITVANLTGQTWASGQARLDLVVADKGSNQVSILLNTSQPGGAMSFNAGPRLNSGGTGPVSTVVGHFTGSPFQDILVSNSGSNNVALLPGVGQGFFNDTNPQKFPVGDNPGPLFVGNFDGKPDLVTVNAGSNDLTLISDFLNADHVTSTISSGGTDPDTAFSFSSGSGFEDLVVGNGGDGVLGLFEGSDQGLTLTSSSTNPDLPSPSALVYAGLSGGQVQFYAATEGREAAALVALSLGGEIAPLAAPAAPATPVVAQLIPLQESSVTLVGTLLITTLPSSEADVIVARAETEVAATVSQSSSAPAAPNQSVLVEIRSDETGGGDEPPAEPQAAKADVQAPDASWQRHVLGTDEAIEKFDREHPDLFQARPADPPETDPSQEHGHSTSDDRLEAIDKAIEDVSDRGVGETHQEFNVTKIRHVGSANPTAAALALAATVAGEFYFGSRRFSRLDRNRPADQTAVRGKLPCSSRRGGRGWGPTPECVLERGRTPFPSQIPGPRLPGRLGLALFTTPEPRATCASRRGCQPFCKATLTIATIPALSASGSSGQAATRAARSGSVCGATTRSRVAYWGALEGTVNGPPTFGAREPVDGPTGPPSLAPKKGHLYGLVIPAERAHRICRTMPGTMKATYPITTTITQMMPASSRPV
jgi:hypothetical protein